MSFPLTPSPGSSPRIRPSNPGPGIPRPPSRSERLLRDALLRDELERHPPLPLPTSTQPGSGTAPYDVEREGEDQALWTLLRGALPPTTPHQPHTQAQTQTQQGSSPRVYLTRNKSFPHAASTSSSSDPRRTPRRHTSPSPAHRIGGPPTTGAPIPHHKHSSSAEEGEMMMMIEDSPHESVLRARLEKVLKAAGAPPGSTPTTSPTPHHQRRRSHTLSPAPDRSHSRKNSGSSLFGYQTMRPDLQKRHTNTTFASTATWVDSSTPNVDSPSESDSRSDSGSEIVTPPINTKHKEAAGGMMMTPPPTPPSYEAEDLGTFRFGLGALKKRMGYPSPQNTTLRNPQAFSPPPNSTFNALQASAQCRAMEGYVSFAAIEGLGEPLEDQNEQGLASEEDQAKGGPLSRILNLKLWSAGATGKKEPEDGEGSTAGVVDVDPPVSIPAKA